VLALHLDDDDGPLSGHVDLGEDVLVYGWRSGTAAVGDRVSTVLQPRDWALFVCCPLEGEPGARTAVIGDPRRYATRGGSGSDLVASTRLRWSEVGGLVPTGGEPPLA
jgi:hypothetical protein